MMQLFLKGQVSPKPESEPLPSGRMRPTEDVISINNNWAALSDGAGGTGVYTDIWAKLLTCCLPECPFADIEALWQYVQQQGGAFLQEVGPLVATNPIVEYKLWREGSAASLAAIWWKYEGGQMMVEWLSYGDSAVMIYQPHLQKLQIQTYLQSPDQFLRNPHLLNWKAQGLSANAFCRSEKPLSFRGRIFWLASDALAQHLYWFYLSHNPKGRKQLDSLLQNYPEAYPLIDRLCKYAKVKSFEEHIAQMKKALRDPKTFQEFCYQLHEKKLLRRDDYALIWLSES